MQERGEKTPAKQGNSGKVLPAGGKGSAKQGSACNATKQSSGKYNPLGWRVSTLCVFLTIFCILCDFFAGLYFFNILQSRSFFEFKFWILIAAITGFAAMVLAVWGVVFGRGKIVCVVAFFVAFVAGAGPVWLTFNTIAAFVRAL